MRIRNAEGLHARPCHALVTTAMGFESDLRVLCETREVNGKSILELMTLYAPCDAELELVAQGRDAAALVERLADLVESGFQDRA